MELSYIIKNANTVTEVVEAINAENSAILAGEYIAYAAYENGFTDSESLAAQSEFIAGEGAEFDEIAAIDHAAKVIEFLKARDAE